MPENKKKTGMGRSRSKTTKEVEVTSAVKKTTSKEPKYGCCGITSPKKEGCRGFLCGIIYKNFWILLALVLSVVAIILSVNPRGGVVNDEIVKNWVKENPAIILESLNNHVMELQKTEMEKRQKQGEVNLPKIKSEIEKNEKMPFAGNPGGKVVIVEFFDYNCGYCKSVTETISQLIQEDGEIKAIFAELPIFGGASLTASRVALTINKMAPEKFYNFHSTLMRENARSEEAIYAVVKKIGLNITEVKANMDRYSEELDEQIAKNREYAQGLGIGGTPAFIIGNKLIPGAIDLEQMREYVRIALDETGK